MRGKLGLWVRIVSFTASFAAVATMAAGAPLDTPAGAPPIRRMLPKYTVTALTTGWTSNAGFAINDSGWVVGQDHLRAFLWRPESPNSMRGSTIALPSLAPNALAAGYGIDAGGNVVGFSRDANSRSHPVKWSGDYSAAGTLGLRAGVIGGLARNVNAAGIAVGQTGLDATNAQVARWDAAGNLTDLGKPAGAQYAFASAINSAGVIAGSAQVNGRQVAFRYADGQYSLLPLPGSSDSSNVNWINSAGQVVGSANGAWWSDGAVSKYLAAVPGTLLPRAANGINDAGIIVGTAVMGSIGSVPTGAIWFGQDATRGYMLNDLIDQSTSAGYLVREAFAINNKGQIAVTSITPTGAYVAALLTPTGAFAPGFQQNLQAVPEPAAIMSLIALGAPLAMRRRKHQHHVKRDRHPETVLHRA